MYSYYKCHYVYYPNVCITCTCRLKLRYTEIHRKVDNKKYGGKWNTYIQKESIINKVIKKINNKNNMECFFFWRSMTHSYHFSLSFKRCLITSKIFFLLSFYLFFVFYFFLPSRFDLSWPFLTSNDADATSSPGRAWTFRICFFSPFSEPKQPRRTWPLFPSRPRPLR